MLCILHRRTQIGGIHLVMHQIAKGTMRASGTHAYMPVDFLVCTSFAFREAQTEGVSGCHAASCLWDDGSAINRGVEHSHGEPVQCVGPCSISFALFSSIADC